MARGQQAANGAYEAPINSVDPRCDFTPRIFVYASRRKQKDIILFFREAVYGFTTRWKA